MREGGQSSDKGLTRRQALAAGILGGAALTAPPLPAWAKPARGTRGRGGLQPELITVSDNGFAAWWATDDPADTVLRIGRADGGGGLRELRLERDQTVHVAALDRLQPDTEYVYELRSGTRRVSRSVHNPGRFRTLPRLEGRRLATIALLNDLHVGEQCSGTAFTIGDKSVPPCYSADDYAWRMSSAALAEVAALEPDLVIANGDLTDRGRPEEIDRCLALLDGTGLPLLITRGNHDRVYHEADAECGGDGDCLRDRAFPENAAGDHALTSVARVGDRVAVVGLDSCDPESGDGRLDLGEQLAWLDSTLTELRGEGRIVIVCFHHYIATLALGVDRRLLYSGVSPSAGGREALRVIAKHDIALTLHGHSHRNYLTRDALAPRTWLLENGATKEYPAGYALLYVHEDGIVRSFHRAATDAFVREWTQTSAQQVWGRQPQITRGTLESRSFVLRFDDRTGPDAPSLITGSTVLNSGTDPVVGTLAGFAGS